MRLPLRIKVYYYNFDSRVVLLQSARFLDGVRQFARHAPDAGNTHLVLPDILVDQIRALFNNHVQNHRTVAAFPHIRRQMDVVQRHILDVSVKGRYGPNEDNVHPCEILTPSPFEISLAHT